MSDLQRSINRLLGLNSVPPAAERVVSRAEILSHLHPESLPELPRIQAETLFGAGTWCRMASYMARMSGSRRV